MSLSAIQPTVDQQAVQRAAAEAAAQAAALQDASNETARVAAQSAADQAAADAAQQAADALYAAGWYDKRGWVSPESAARARDAGIAAGGSVPDTLRCGTSCGEPPTSAELEQQLLDDRDLSNSDGSSEDDSCDDGYPSGGTCYPDYDAAAAACGGYLIRGNCYESAEAARAAGEGE